MQSSREASAKYGNPSRSGKKKKLGLKERYGGEGKEKRSEPGGGVHRTLGPGVLGGVVFCSPIERKKNLWAMGGIIEVRTG